MPQWVVLPFRNRWDLTTVAIEDCLNQQGLPTPPQVLVIYSGDEPTVRQALEGWTERQPRLHAWVHQPPLPSLAAIWNRGLRFVWQQGGEHALVVNNDVRLHLETYAVLQRIAEAPMSVPEPFAAEPPLFVSAVGRREADMDWVEYFNDSITVSGSKGGPDYSCFLITRAGHTQYPFDEGFIPAYCEDCDHHRQLMLGGDGHRIFSVNLPYLHYGSCTVNAEVTQRQAWATRLQRSRDYYRRKWGGDVNAERYTIPFDASTAQDGVTNPELQRRISAEPTDPAR